MGANGGVLADFQGGLVVAKSDGSIVKLDGLTGQARTLYTLPAQSGAGVGVHPDGTVFAVRRDGENSWSVVGLDPVAGLKFTVTLSSACTVAGVSGNIGQLIVAGDGYGYLPYSCVGNGVNYLGTYRVSSGGAWDNIAVASSPNPRGERIAPPYVITNADTGVLLSWEDVPTGAKMLAVTTGTAARVTSGPVISGQGFGAVRPVLQAQDGSFVGTTSLATGETPRMVAFDGSGRCGGRRPTRRRGSRRRRAG